MVGVGVALGGGGGRGGGEVALEMVGFSSRGSINKPASTATTSCGLLAFQDIPDCDFGILRCPR